MVKNVSSWDRYLRLTAGLLALEAAYFWLASPWNWVGYAVAAILVVTAFFRFCPLYKLLGVSPKAETMAKSHTLLSFLAAATLLVVAIGGSYASMFLTRKFFLEDFNAMNNFYKQTLFLTGQGNRDEAVRNFELWSPAFAVFRDKYTAYRPYDLRNDEKLVSDFQDVGAIITGVEPMIRSGDLHEAHLALEKVRPIFQETFKRNGFSLLAVALVDFHDAMETILTAATGKDAAQVIALYAPVDEKLKAVEAAANDSDIQNIRKALDALQTAAQAGESNSLPDLGNALKSSFVKVYLQRG